MKIVWSLENPDSKAQVHASSVELLKSLEARNALEIQPVYILQKNALELSVNFRVDHLKDLEQQALSHLSERLGGVSFQGMLPPKVLVQVPGTGQTALQMLTEFAAKENADLLLAPGLPTRAGVAASAPLVLLRKS